MLLAAYLCYAETLVLNDEVVGFPAGASPSWTLRLSRKRRRHWSLLLARICMVAAWSWSGQRR